VLWIIMAESAPFCRFSPDPPVPNVIFTLRPVRGVEELVNPVGLTGKTVIVAVLFIRLHVPPATL
jgi:hypothetical protein